ncbi:MAG TPA: hypothetical protein VI685_10135 [Candidatus Angelobacter sp.]
MSEDNPRLRALLLLVPAAVCVILLSCRRSQPRPANVPSTAVLVHGNYIACVPRVPEEAEINPHYCTVYSGATGEVLGNDPMLERLRDMASRKGGSAIDCGQMPDSRVSQCVQTAFQNGKAFFARYEGALASTYGLAGDAEGNISWIVYDLRGFSPIAAGRFTQLFDANHTRVTSCVPPVKLGSIDEGLLGCITPVNEEASARAAQEKPIETTVCAVTENPAAFNNKMVRLHGHLFVNFEYSMFSGDGCSGVLWFTYAGVEWPPGLVLYLGGGATPGAEDADGKRILPVPVKLVRDPNLDGFERLLKARAGAKRIKRSGFPFHRVSATFVGRIDAVSQEVHAFHLTPAGRLWRDLLGFGPMGGYDAQFVMQSVENDAVLEERSP